jgi:hypothetical protein
MSEASRTDADVRDLSRHAVLARIIRLAFGGNRKRYEEFLRTIREAIPPDVSVVLRGSALTGTRWADGKPFDGDGPGTSDLDLTFVGGDILQFWSDDAFYIPKLHTVPLSDSAPDAAPVLVPLRRSLCRIARRPVNIQGTSNFLLYLRDVVLGQPYVTLIQGEEREEEEEGDAPA